MIPAGGVICYFILTDWTSALHITEDQKMSIEKKSNYKYTTVTLTWLIKLEYIIIILALCAPNISRTCTVKTNGITQEDRDKW